MGLLIIISIRFQVTIHIFATNTLLSLTTNVIIEVTVRFDHNDADDLTRQQKTPHLQSSRSLSDLCASYCFPDFHLFIGSIAMVGMLATTTLFILVDITNKLKLLAYHERYVWSYVGKFNWWSQWDSNPRVEF